jgi:methyl-accepting chemotaxis protein
MEYSWTSKANRAFFAIIISQFFFGLLIAYNYGGWTEAIVIGFLVACLPLILLLTRPEQFSTHIVVAIAVQLAVALHIHLAQGLIEIHFEIFALMAFLIIYRSWQVILASVLVVAVHHIVFFIMQLNSLPVFIFEQGHVSFSILVIHAVFAVIEAGILMYIAKDSFEEGQAAHQIKTSVHKMLLNQNSVDLNIALLTDNKELEEFNRLVVSFRRLIEKAKQIGADSLHSVGAVEKISQRVDTNVQNNSEQVSRISQAIEEMIETTNDVASRAENASEHAGNSQMTTEEVHRIVADSDKAVTELEELIGISASSVQQLSTQCGQIADVMNAITSISEQTNLLALNAAIESARAGEHGRGFAVVADEVRQLATKTRENAESISGVVQNLIKDAELSVAQMTQCLDKVQAVSESSTQITNNMTSVTEGIHVVADNIRSVATAAEEQSMASSSISGATDQLRDTSTNQIDEVKNTQAELIRLIEQIKQLNEELDSFIV